MTKCKNTGKRTFFPLYVGKTRGVRVIYFQTAMPYSIEEQYMVWESLHFCSVMLNHDHPVLNTHSNFVIHLHANQTAWVTG